MIERHVTFSVLPDKCRDFETFFVEQYRPGMSTMPGFVKVELLREAEQTSQYQMVIRFESLETAAEWRNSTVHKGLQPAFKSLYSESTLQVYEVIA
ncbi:MAG: antibiotic biosynthesis monooxygenase family protein [Anaerolineae bacterium]